MSTRSAGAGGNAAAQLVTRFRDVVPEGRVELVLRLHDFGEEPGLAFLVKRRVSAEAAAFEHSVSQQTGFRGSKTSRSDTHRMYVMTPMDQQSTALL